MEVEALVSNSDLLIHHLPIAVIIAKHRKITLCNACALEMFRASSELVLGASFEVLYPERKDFEVAAQYFGPLLSRHASFQENRLMRRLDGTHFWATVRGYVFNPQAPYELATWVFTDVPDDEQAYRGQSVVLTARERDVAALMVDGLTSKEAARRLNISPRTVDIHRCNLLKKYGVNTTAELVKLVIN